MDFKAYSRPNHTQKTNSEKEELQKHAFLLRYLIYHACMEVITCNIGPGYTEIWAWKNPI